MIPAAVRAGFGLTGAPRPLPGGAGTSVLVDGVVCKPAEAPAVAAWCQELAEECADAADVTFPSPVRAIDGRHVVDGWTASRFVPGLRSLEHDPVRVVELAGAVAVAIAEGLTRCSPMPPRTDRWARGIAVAHGERTEALSPAATARVERLRKRVVATGEPPAIVHADLTGNSFLTRDGSALVLDLSPAWATPGFAAAVVVADHLLWHDGGRDLAALVDPSDLARALIFRLVAEQLADTARHGADVADYDRVAALLGW